MLLSAVAVLAPLKDMTVHGLQRLQIFSPVQSVAATLAERGERHRERMAGVSERGVDHIETMDGPDILNSVDQIEKRFSKLESKIEFTPRLGGLRFSSFRSPSRA